MAETVAPARRSPPSLNQISEHLQTIMEGKDGRTAIESNSVSSKVRVCSIELLPISTIFCSEAKILPILSMLYQII